MEAIYNWIWRIIIIYIVMSIWIYLLPDEQYHKLIRPFIGIVWILIVINPVFEKISRTDLINDLWYKMERISRKTELMESEDALEGIVKENYLDYYKEELKQAIITYGAEHHVLIKDLDMILEYDNVLYLTLYTKTPQGRWTDQLADAFGIKRENIRVRSGI